MMLNRTEIAVRVHQSVDFAHSGTELARVSVE
jgi:hypothetical protein